MAQQTAQQTRFIGERVRALATILLTGRDDISIREVAEDIGLDLIVTVNDEKKAGLRQFGIELRGVWQKTSADHANRALRPSMSQMLRFGPFPFPVVLFFYTMENDAAWYTWAIEPATGGINDHELTARQDAYCQLLDEAALNKIIGRVHDYYDAFYAKTFKAGKQPRK